MMIQNTTFLRRAVGSLLVALVALVGFQTQAQLEFESTTAISWPESSGFGTDRGTATQTLNDRIGEAFPGTPAETNCYAISGTPAAALEFSETTGFCTIKDAADAADAESATGRRAANLDLALKDGQHIDFEKGKDQELVVTGYGADGKAKEMLTVKLTITDYDERPLRTQAKAPTWYWSPNDSGSLLVSQLFSDPEGSPVFFDPMGARNTDVWVCDAADAGDLMIEESPADAETRPDGTSNGPGSAITFENGSPTDNCSVSNPARTEAPLGGAKGTGGNRVVTTKLTGPVLTITADSLVTSDGTTETARPRGTYAATVYIRAWSHTVAANPALSPVQFASVNIQVKIGANNIPQFAGGATGYQVEMNEGVGSAGVSNSGPMAAWLAGDLDDVENTNDSLTYSLAGANDKGEVSVAGGTMTLQEIPDVADTNDVDEHALQLNGKGLDYEHTTSFTVTINVTDNWSDPVSVPVTVTLKNVNELEIPLKADGKTPNMIGDQNMVKGLKRTFDLNEYFHDPEGDTITFAAFTNIETDIVSIDDAGVLTITGPAAGEYTATLTATDDGTPSQTETYDFKITSRDANAAPKITLVESGTIAVGASVFEADSAGEELTKVAYTDDDPKPTAILTGATAELFTATVDEKSGMVVISVGDEDLNFEMAPRHVLTLALQDAWDDIVNPDTLEIQVSVNDSNDAPTVKEDAEIADQSIVVHGSGSLYTGNHFEDEDGDRLLVDAVSSDMTKVTVTTSGLDGVKFSGVAETEDDAPVTITLTASDPDGASATLTFDVTVGPNNGPVSDPDAFAMRLPADNTINVGATADIALDGLFSEPDSGDAITSITATSSDEDVLLVVLTGMDDGIATLVGRDSGTATLTITAMDRGGNATPVETVITVNAAPEEAMPLDPQTLDRVTPHVVDVSGVFTDSDDGNDSLVITAEAVEGMDRVTLEVSGFDLTITGVMGIEPGDVTIELTATDPHGSAVKSSFVATIVNVAPTVAMSVDAQELDRIDPLSVDVNEVFADVDGEISAITASVEEDAVIEVGEIDLEDGLLTVTALAVGEATVTLEATDNNGGMVSDTFMVTVNNVDPVVANAIMDQTATRIMDLTLDISETFDDPDTDSALTFSVMAENDKIAKASVEGSMLTVEGLYVGSTTITITATDVDGGTFSHDFMVEIQNVKPTVAMAIDDMSFDRIAPLGIDLSDTFADADGMISTLTAMVGDGSIVEAMIEDSTLTLTALAVGDTTITLTAVDDNGGDIMTDFMVTVVNIVPVVANAVADQTTTRVDDLTLDISSTFDDPDQDNSMLSITVAVDDGTTVEAALEGHMLMVSGLEVGSANVTLTAVDADGGMVSDTFMTTIENVDPVVANSIADQEMDRRAPLTLDLTETFMDADDGAPTITVMIGSGAVLSHDLTDMMLSLTALAVGETVVTLTATDVNGASVMDEFNVTVINIEPVVANAVPDQTTTRVDDLSIDVGATFDDPDQDNSMLSLTVTVADGTYVDASLSGSTLMISGLDVGATMVTLTAVDADGGMVETSFTTTIENIAPVVANSISPINLEVGGQAAAQAIAGLFSDDGDPLTYSIASANSGIASTSITGMTAMVGPVSRGATNFTITAMDPHGGEASVTGSVTVGDGELKAVAAKSLAGFGRAMLASVSSSVGSRVMSDARSSDLTLDAWAPAENQSTMAMNVTAEDRSDAAWNVVQATTTASATPTSAAHGAQMNGLDALRSTLGQNFALNLGSSDNPSNWAVWGDVDRQSYEGAGYDGMATSVYLGADVTVAECWMFGVAISSNSGESDYSWGTATQTMDLSLTTVLPYVSYQPNNGSSIWGVAGFGSGELDTTVVGAANDVSDLSSTITMVGGSQDLTSVGRFNLALRGDAAMASLETEDGNGAADGLAADVNRIRVGLEGSFRTETGQGGMLEPFGQVSLRSDGGDGDTGTGIEIAGGVRMTSSTFTLEAQGRTLAMHGADEYSESGFSLMAKLNPSASATGVSVSIAPRWGADAMGNGMLWQDSLSVGTANTYGALTGFGNVGANKSIDTQIGYGMLVANEQYLFTPFVDYGVSDGDRRELLFGASLRQLVQGNANLDINLALGRVEERTGASSGKIGLNANLRF